MYQCRRYLSSVSRMCVENINQNVVKAEYAVRGPIVLKSAEIAAALRKEGHGYPFNQIISCNIGNPQALEQQPLSFGRDVLSCVLNPALIGKKCFADDVEARARHYLANMPSMGSYTDSAGLAVVRDDVVQFLQERDGYPADRNDIFLTNGASEAVRFTMQSLVRPGEKDSILTPIPQYPMYSALTTLLEGELAPYYLDEAAGWSCSIENLTASFERSKAAGENPRALVVINPGNPTGQVLPEANMREIVDFCRRENLVLLADEVYQKNVYKEGSKFVSFRKVAYDMQAFEGASPLQLFSFHSISKGFTGECGLRGGYFEVLGVDPAVKAQIMKLITVSLSSNTVGQVATGLMVNPPKPGDASYPTYEAEVDAIMQSLKRRSVVLSRELNKLEGVSCTAIEGAMYAFPTITLPDKAIAAAKAAKVAPDAFYCMSLLEKTGIVVVPGSGFKQVDGTFHFRTTILPPEDKIQQVVKLLADFHAAFMQEYR